MLKSLVSFIVVFLLANTIIGYPFLNATASDMNANNFEELRDNLVEVRLALQNGDLTEALQHLNNAEEQLLLFEENVTSNSTIPQ
jgi:regulatory protein YycI of two-component signal transduction system YycFG